MSVQPVAPARLIQPGPTPSLILTIRKARARLGPIVAGAAQGFAVGMLVLGLACAAYAAENLRTGLRIADWAIGIVLTAIPMVLLFVVLRTTTVVLAWVLGWLSRHGPPRPRQLVESVIPTLRVVGHPLVASTISVALMTWASPSEGVLAVYHSLFFFEILIVTGAVVGLLVGAALAAGRTGFWRPHTRAVTVATLVPALALGVGVGAWAMFPGPGDAVVREAPAAIATIPALDLPDPSQRGPCTVVAATYGSGRDGRRAGYGSAVDWTTPTVDASAALGERGEIDTPYATWFWGFDATELPLNGLIWYPSNAPDPMPVALIVHGNHGAADYSDPGYAYLAEHLASRGIIAVSLDENYLNGDSFFDYSGAEMGTRAWLLLRHLEQLRTWDATPGHPLAGRVDLQRVALIGHSRGGEAAAVAAMLESNPGSLVPGLPPVPRGFGIRTVIAFAPSDGMYSGPGSPTMLRDLDYLVIQGAHDGDLPGFTGLQTYHRVQFSGKGDHLKVALYSERSNHGRFNSVWDYGDAGALVSWMLDRGSMLSTAEQQHLAKTVVGAFLARSLQGATAYDAFFREPRAGRAWLPDDIVETHWQSSGRVVVDDFGAGTIDGNRHLGSGFTSIVAADPPQRDGATQHDRAALLTWSAGASYTLAIDGAIARAVDPHGSLVFSMAPSVDGSAAADPLIELRTTSGLTAIVRLSDNSPGRPLLPTQLWKIAGLGDRYLSNEAHRLPAERFLQTHDVALAAFTKASPGFDLAGLTSVTLRFDTAGAVYLDDVGFEPGVSR